MDQNNKADIKRTTRVANTDGGSSEISASRRSLIKGAAGTLPMILTLQSGAALARSSNLITPSSAASAKDLADRTLCFDESTVWRVYHHPKNGEIYDLNSPPSGAVQAISERDYVAYDELGNVVAITEEQMCELGGTFSFEGVYGMEPVSVNHGMLVSAAHLSSFSGYIDIIDI